MPAKKKPDMSEDGPTPAVIVPKLAITQVRVPIRGTAPLIVHAWSEKARRQILDTQQGRRKVKEIRNPDADYDASLYRTQTGYGFPTNAFRMATISAARFYGKDVTMVGLRQCLFMRGVSSDDGSTLLTPIDGEPKMREDMVRVGMKAADLRFRAEFRDWEATLNVRFVTTSIGVESVAALIDAGGLGVGVGEWRPEKNGTNGTYEICDELEIL